MTLMATLTTYTASLINLEVQNNVEDNELQSMVKHSIPCTIYIFYTT